MGSCFWDRTDGMFTCHLKECKYYGNPCVKEIKSKNTECCYYLPYRDVPSLTEEPEERHRFIKEWKRKMLGEEMK